MKYRPRVVTIEVRCALRHVILATSRLCNQCIAPEALSSHRASMSHDSQTCLFTPATVQLCNSRQPAPRHRSCRQAALDRGAPSCYEAQTHRDHASSHICLLWLNCRQPIAAHRSWRCMIWGGSRATLWSRPISTASMPFSCGRTSSSARKCR